MKNILYKIFVKNGIIKTIIAFMIALVFATLTYYNIVDLWNYFLIIMLYVVINILIGFYYAYIKQVIKKIFKK